jgi:Uma2 family endonuclease
MAGTQTPVRTRPWPPQGQWTYEDWLELPDDGARYEVVDGELHVTPPPTIAHQRASLRLVLPMARFVEETGVGEVLEAPVGVRLPGQPVPLEPDIVFVSAAGRATLGPQYIEGVPDLVVEVLSPGSSTYDRGKKLRAYQAAGVPEYWLLDYEARTIEVLVLENREYVPLGIWAPGECARSRVLAGFEVAVDEVFRS